MSLRWKVVLLLCGVFVVLMGMIRLIDDAIVVPSFVRLEREQAATDLSRCVKALESEVESVDKLCREWAAAYHAADVDAASSFDPPFSPDVLRNEDLGVLQVLDADGEEVWGQAWPPDCDVAVGAEAAFDCGIAPGHPLRSENDPSRMLKGLVVAGPGLLIASSHPICGPEHGAIQAGRVIVGRWLDGRCRQRIVERTCVALDINRIVPGEANAVARVSAALRGPSDMFLDDADAATLHVYCEQNDVNGAPLVLLRARIARHITAAGNAARDFLLSALVSLLVIILVLVWMQLEIMVVKPVQQLRDHVTQVGRNGDLETRFEALRSDELGELCRSFNDMTGSLAEYRRRLVDTAHRSGMSDTAANILHNVGNVLNSVFVSTDVLSTATGQSRVTGLVRAAEMLQANRENLGAFLTEDERGRKLPDYLLRLAELLGDEQQSLASEVQLLQEKVQHIRDVITTQQALASGPRLATREQLDEIVTEVVAVHEELLRRQGIDVRIEFGALPAVRVSRPKLNQVLDNLIKNAAEAIAARPRDASPGQAEAARCIRLTGAVTPEGVTLQVADTGMGFDPSAAEQIFRLGYTTKAEGHGLGLHYCANALTEMGATIRAESAGPGRGATFILTLPFYEGSQRSHAGPAKAVLP